MGLRFEFAIILAVIFFYTPCYSEKAPYRTFAKEATSAPPVVYYDYIVIGGGTAGCALAATLSENANVLLLERGGLPYGNPNITSINGFFANIADTSPSSPTQPFNSTDGVFNYRARVLGGGSAFNAGFWSRATQKDILRAGWDQNLVNESYEWVEKKIVFKPTLAQWQAGLRDGLLEAGVLPYNGFSYDHIFGTKIGGTIFDQNGTRHTSADLLEYADASKIIVYLHAIVDHILFEVEGQQQRPRAHGVVFTDGEGKRHAAYLNKGSYNEIIVSAGTLGSTQMLMLSGIGPAAQLKAHNISVVLDQPNVGQGMADNPINGLLIPSTRPLGISMVQVVGITQFGSYIESLTSSIPLSFAQRLIGQIRKLTNLTNIEVGFIFEKIMGPLSTGYLELQTTNADDNPKITFNYFKDPTDLQRCVQGMKTVIKVVQSKSISNFRYRFLSVQDLINLVVALPLNNRPKHVQARHSLEQYCKDTILTIGHYHGGCHVGKVIDHEYNVLGVNALRVVDSSTFPASPGTNPQATVMMLGRYVGQRILKERLANLRK